MVWFSYTYSNTHYNLLDIVTVVGYQLFVEMCITMYTRACHKATNKRIIYTTFSYASTEER